MGYWAIVCDIRERYNEQHAAPIAIWEAEIRAQEEILCGFRNREEAWEAWETFRKRKAALFTMYGYEVSSRTLKTALLRRYKQAALIAKELSQ